MTGFRWERTVTIPLSGGVYELSAGNDFDGGAKDMGVIMPATWTDAAISFQVSTAIDGTYVSLYKEDGTTEVTAAVKQAKTMSLNTVVPYISQFRFVKVRSGTAALAVDQGATRTLTFIFQR